MKILKILSKKKLIDKTVNFLEKETDNIYRKYENIEGCDSGPCNEEKAKLTEEMNCCIDKLHREEKELDACEAEFFACSGDFQI
jgi:hypothetical protein